MRYHPPLNFCRIIWHKHPEVFFLEGKTDMTGFYPCLQFPYEFCVLRTAEIKVNAYPFGRRKADRAHCSTPSFYQCTG